MRSAELNADSKSPGTLLDKLNQTVPRVENLWLVSKSLFSLRFSEFTMHPRWVYIHENTGG